jgi:hypothetical protein
MCSSISYTSSNGLKDEKKTTVMIRAVTEVCDLVATDHQMTIKWNINYTFSRCFMKILDAGSSTPSLLHTHTHSLTYWKEEHRVVTGKDFIAACRPATRLIHWVTTADFLLFPK